MSQRAGSGHPPLSAKSAADCEQHYSSCFLASPASPLPDLSKLLCGRDGGALTSEEVLRLRAEKAKQTNLKKQLGASLPRMRRAALSGLLASEREGVQGKTLCECRNTAASNGFFSRRVQHPQIESKHRRILAPARRL